MSDPHVYVLTRFTIGGDIREVKGVFLTREGAVEHSQALSGGQQRHWVEHGAHGAWWESEFDAPMGKTTAWWTIEEMELRQ